MNDSQPNHEQATFWNEQGGPRWVEMGRQLDAQLEPFGLEVARRLGLAAGERVLDVGCGAGATSLMLAERVKQGQVVGVDISAPLVERARARGKGVENVRFELADAQTFAFTGEPYDVVFSRFGVMFFDDPDAAFRNIRTALRPGGRLGFVCWRPMKDNLGFVLPLQAVMPFLAEAPPPPEPGAPGPFAFADGERTRGILERAGYVDVAITPHDSELVFGGQTDIEAAVDLALQVGPASRALASIPEISRTEVRAALRAAFLPYHGPSGVKLPAATWLVTARRGNLSG
jgi:SAM-dependent methyltransferase